MRFKNSWMSPTKQWDRFEIKLRLGYFTIFDFSLDISGKNGHVTLINFTFEW
jgi:hypothetical protein